ncbi:Oxysterol-binding protein-related protein 10 [Manis javanica]|nr:Oxysterol-binding protein-related protein 10 [Manis javanica]
MTHPQARGEWEASSLSAQDSFPPHLGTARGGKRVQVKPGVAASWDRAEVLEPPSKKTREECALPEGAPKTSSPLCAQERLPDSVSGLESKAPQEDVQRRNREEDEAAAAEEEEEKSEEEEEEEEQEEGVEEEENQEETIQKLD